MLSLIWGSREEFTSSSKGLGTVHSIELTHPLFFQHRNSVCSICVLVQDFQISTKLNTMTVFGDVANAARNPMLECRAPQEKQVFNSEHLPTKSSCNPKARYVLTIL